jgi:hypothetical protein
LKKYIYIFPPELHTHDFVVLNSSAHPRKILSVVLQTGKIGNRISQRHISTPTYAELSIPE